MERHAEDDLDPDGLDPDRLDPDGLDPDVQALDPDVQVLDSDEAVLDPDEEALRWAGDEERGVADRAARASRAPGAADAFGVEGPASDAIAPVPDAQGRGSRSRTVVLALFAVVYLAWTVGWAFAVQGLSSGASDLLAEISWQFGEFLAMFSAAFWFAAVWSLARNARTGALAGRLALGAVILVPWPAVLALAGGTS